MDAENSPSTSSCVSGNETTVRVLTQNMNIHHFNLPSYYNRSGRIQGKFYQQQEQDNAQITIITTAITPVNTEARSVIHLPCPTKFFYLLITS